MYDNKMERPCRYGDAFDLNYRNSPIKDAEKDDLLSLEKNLTSEKISKIEEVNSRIDT